MSDDPTVPVERSRYLEGILLALLAAVLALQLVVPPIVGLADNGDFSRVAGPLGIFPAEHLGDAAFFSWIVPQYRFEPKRIWIRGLCCYSSQTLFGVAALPVGLAISPPRRFDLRATGIVYSRSTPRLLRRIYLFNAVFRELLPNSPDPGRDLAELGPAGSLPARRNLGREGRPRSAPPGRSGSRSFSWRRFSSRLLR